MSETVLASAPCAVTTSAPRRSGARSAELYLPVRIRRYDPPMLRSLFNFLSLVSLLLCVATCMLWVRSYNGTDYVSRSQVVSSQPYAVLTRIHSLGWTR